MVYRKGASASGVNEVAAPRDSINLLKNAGSDRVSGGNEGFAHIADSKFCHAKLALNDGTLSHTLWWQFVGIDYNKRRLYAICFHYIAHL